MLNGTARLKKLSADESGATVLEFALIMPLFLLILFAIIEFGLIMHVSSLVENSAHEAARRGITGSNYADINQDGLNREDFINKQIKEALGVWLRDDEQLRINTNVIGSITELGTAGVETDTHKGYGSGGQAVIYNITFFWDVITPLMGDIIGRDGHFPISATVAVKNEDFCGRRSCFGT